MIACGRYVEPAFPSSRRYASPVSRHALPMVDYTSVKARARFHTVCRVGSFGAAKAGSIGSVPPVWMTDAPQGQ